MSDLVSTSGAFPDGDVRLDSVELDGKTLKAHRLVTVARAKILIDDGVDAVRGGHNFASGQGINSELDDYAPEGPATIEPTSADLQASLDNASASPACKKPKAGCATTAPTTRS